MVQGAKTSSASISDLAGRVRHCAFYSAILCRNLASFLLSLLYSKCVVYNPVLAIILWVGTM